MNMVPNVEYSGHPTCDGPHRRREATLMLVLNLNLRVPLHGNIVLFGRG